MVLHPLVLLLQERIPTLRANGWFVHDGLLGGSKEELKEAATILIQEGPRRGLHLSTEVTVPGDSKSAVWPPLHRLDRAHPDPLGLGIKVIEDLGFTHLGVPLGEEDFILQGVKSRVEKVRQLLDKLPTLEDPHSEFALL